MKIKICIIGPGVVGQATGKVFARLGFNTAFLGGNPEKTKKLRKEGYRAYLRNALFDGSYDFDISMLTVPTPTVNGQINFDAIASASVDIGKRLKLRRKKSYHLVVVKSTVPPGTSEDIVAKLVEKHSGLIIGKDFGLCMNPEYLREKTAYSDALKPWVILIGQYDKRSGDMLAEVYKKFKCPIFRCTTQEAEFQKYVHNLFNAVKITFFNEMRRICKEFSFDTKKLFEVTALSAEGMWNPKYGIKDLGPFSGSCLPKDTQAFLRWVHNNGAAAHLLKTIIEVNEMLTRENGEVKKTIIGSEL
ncbi:hypothetical protein A2954_04880 [Candidatus Roizmanbacteria bacterium RIFCSPLOWO2_01_FULL_37_12]|uniref:UDP-glucose/GDP-mannose dehydrogenase dimerisation domain-containing protein n=1 Tax=Candidatus Roizmanbacteria bacterium RIFCSPLOWO2_01_FULL_37_12 TaxID=1802056 RepID=A0A1F7I8Q4_9BACT|nr:MAG: hypothetical protein A2768_01970 [Candidatus Roizmanbacteria bacterium RIFCSPHIGHO2_01_FULL_37_16]OGK23696.1 MAG: hypothetical protein A3D76_03920 [Candidatus Roizmanbacteria bacterium RIFCSPHIGHO2_02_FULL_37_9b]OGK39733.1 MAG: hypothetical protein A2954_04880 [Candidatus Roizmanbacteria bacterium RIFCSPLOWO2_01_FULL_37_12]